MGAISVDRWVKIRSAPSMVWPITAESGERVPKSGSWRMIPPKKKCFFWRFSHAAAKKKKKKYRRGGRKKKKLSMTVWYLLVDKKCKTAAERQKSIFPIGITVFSFTARRGNNSYFPLPFGLDSLIGRRGDDGDGMAGRGQTDRHKHRQRDRQMITLFFEIISSRNQLLSFNGKETTVGSN